MKPVDIHKVAEEYAFKDGYLNAGIRHDAFIAGYNLALLKIEELLFEIEELKKELDAVRIL